MNTTKSKQQNSKKQSGKVIVKDQRPTANLHPLFAGMFRQMFPHAYNGGK